MKNKSLFILSMSLLLATITTPALSSYYTKKVKVQVKKMYFTKSCNVRALPKTNSVRVDYLTQGEKFYTTGKPSKKGWYPVVLADKKTQGHVSATCFNVSRLKSNSRFQ